MSYRSEPIALAIGRMNRQYFLPAIQREFVWKPEQIVGADIVNARGGDVLSLKLVDGFSTTALVEKIRHGS